TPADALERRQHFPDDAAAALERRTNCRFLRVERLQTRLGVGDLGFDLAQFCRAVDQRLVELAPVVADLLDLALDLGFGLGRLLLLLAQRLELFVALLQRVGLVAPLRLSGPGRLLRRRGRRQSEAKSREQRGTPAERARFAPEGHRSDVKP